MPAFFTIPLLLAGHHDPCRHFIGGLTAPVDQFLTERVVFLPLR